MKKTDDLIFDFNQKQKKFDRLQSFNLNRDIYDEGYSEYSLKIVLCKYPFYNGDKKLILNFFGVKELKINNLNGLLCLLIKITNISEYQMEGIHYKIVESENEIFSFYCETFKFEII